jgi:hypothetical protein
LQPTRPNVDEEDALNTALGGAAPAAALEGPHLNQMRSLPVSATARIRVGGVPTLTYIRYSNGLDTTSETAPLPT